VGIKGKLAKISGPLVLASPMIGARMSDVVRVGKANLIGEIIELNGDTASIQVYEETGGLKPGDPVESTGEPLSVELGPGLIESIYDGIQRPLDIIKEMAGAFIPRGVEVPAISRTKKWEFVPTKKKGALVLHGDIIGEVKETELFTHKIMIPHGISGKIETIKSGSFKVTDIIAVIKTDTGKTINLNMIQKWPVRISRRLKEKLPPTEPLVTGQRIIDTLFPIAKGGTACIPGPFGSGKTVVQHQLAKWSDADLIVFVGCGERGNEMTDVLREFPDLKDPKTGKPLMQKTVLIANTSNMPIAAREASVYTGVTIAEYFRDMGYSVAIMADSTSRWAEALREMSGRLEEMPGDEGYPAYLGSRVAEYYERAGKGICHGSDKRQGSLSVIGSVSPPGGDLSEPVVQNTLRVVKVFWGLDDKLAFQRHFPAINWLLSYSLYESNLGQYFKEKVSEEWIEIRAEALKLLQEEANLEEIVRLVGLDALSQKEQLVMFSAKMIREDFLYQSAFELVDSFTSLDKQFKMIKLIIEFNRLALGCINSNAIMDNIKKVKIIQKIATMKYIEEKNIKQFDLLLEEMKGEFNCLEIQEVQSA